MAIIPSRLICHLPAKFPQIKFICAMSKFKMRKNCCLRLRFHWRRRCRILRLRLTQLMNIIFKLLKSKTVVRLCVTPTVQPLP